MALFNGLLDWSSLKTGESFGNRVAVYSSHEELYNVNCVAKVEYYFRWVSKKWRVNKAVFHQMSHFAHEKLDKQGGFNVSNNGAL